MVNHAQSLLTPCIENKARSQTFDAAIINFRRFQNQFQQEQREYNDSIDILRLNYSKADPKAIERYVYLVLSRSSYPDFFHINWELEYRPEPRMIIIDYRIPPPEKIPVVLSYKYIASRDEVTEKLMSESAKKELYEDVIYQLCLRAIFEVFDSDAIGAVDMVAFNGIVTSTNKATGVEETKVILSVSVQKEAFMGFDLSKVSPKATFKHLKGVSAASLIDLTPIPPIIKMDRTDRRFIEGKDITGALDDSVNLAAMDWEDFEHLVRELFEREFLASGGEVRVTQASSDGGVDAIAFDPDPIRGGKIVIQAKRYTKTVGVAAVRDLYGTVLNEGATKGILVTTSDYGKDSYEFAKGKPLTLLNGSNLLSLLEKHGHRARINIAEARKILVE